MSKNVVLTNANGEQILPITTYENVFDGNKTLKEELESINNDLENVVSKNTNHILFIFSNKATSGGIYYTNSVFMPQNLTFTLSQVNFVGSSGNFVDQVEIVRNGNYIYLTAINPALAGLTASCVGTIS